MSKSHVSLEKHICAVCGHPFATGGILIDKRLRESLEPTTVTGYGMCPEHQKLKDDGFVALVEVDPDKSGVVDGTEAVKLHAVYRTGAVAHVRVALFPHLINVPVPPEMMLFVEPGVIEKMQAMMPQEDEEPPKEDKADG